VWRFPPNYDEMSTLFLGETTQKMLTGTNLTDSRLAARQQRSQPQTMPTGEQIRAARALLRWSAAELARRARVSHNTVSRCEAVDGVPRVQTATLERIRHAFEAAGIEFTQNAGRSGVHLRRR